MTEVQRWEKPRDAAAEAVVWAAVEAAAKEKAAEAKEFVAEHLRSESLKGVDAVANGVVIGSVTRSKDGERVDVTDLVAFAEWIASRHPTALQVNYSWKQKFLPTLTRVETESGAVFVDGSGEVVPGVGVRVAQGSVRLNKSKESVELVKQLIDRSSEHLLQLTRGQS